jgi:GDP-mannose 6-dehydrogenase
VKVAVFGLGYVGSVTAACLASRGHTVIGVDVNAEKIAAFRDGQPPVMEPGLGELMRTETAAGRLDATTDPESALAGADVSLICVGTPSAPNGSLDTTALERVASTIGELLPHAPVGHTVTVRSTVLPGTTENILIPLLEEHSGSRAGDRFGVAVNPEFLREGSSVTDFSDPSRTLVGEFDERSGATVLQLYESLPGAKFRVGLRIAETAKYVDNAYHALKVAFANEIGNFCRASDIDSHQVMEVFKADNKLNISPAYLTPGFAFGGSCLPKDLRALLHAAGRMDVELPVLQNVLRSNDLQVTRAVDVVRASGVRRVGVFGLAFKPHTDDLRESPLVELCERLLGKGLELKIFDPEIALSRIVGSNRAYIDEHIPHLSRLLAPSAEEVLNHAELCVVGAYHSETAAAFARDGEAKPILDLVRLPDADARRDDEGYFSVTW